MMERSPSPERLAELLAQADQAPEASDETLRSLRAELDTIGSYIASEVTPDDFEQEDACKRLLLNLAAFDLHLVAQAPEVAANEEAELTQIRDYKLLSKLGAGGMGTVYKALHTQLDKIVALKVLPAGKLQDKQTVERFQREMRAVGRTEHPHIVRALDGGEDQGRHFLVMEYVSGTDLAKLVAQSGPLRLADACELIRQTALGLQEAHECGLIHRDIKPSNLMLATQKQQPPIVKILDLGLAQLANTKPQTGEELTAAGQLMGTVDYMAPEQAVDSRNVDIRADIFSLGATFFKLLTGKTIFAGRTYENAMQKVVALHTITMPAVRDYRSEVPPELAVIVHRMLAKDPADRYADPLAVVRALEPFCSGSDLNQLLPRDEVTAASPANLAAQEQQPSWPSINDPTAPFISRQNDAGQTEPQSASSAGGRTVFIPWLLGLLGGAGALTLLAVMLWIPTKHGTVCIEILDPSIQVTVNGKGQYHVQGKEQAEFDVAVGKHHLEITSGKTKFRTKEFSITGNEQVQLRIALLDDKAIQVLQGGKVFDEHPLTEEASPAMRADSGEVKPTQSAVAPSPSDPPIVAAEGPGPFALEFTGGRENGVIVASTRGAVPGKSSITFETWIKRDPKMNHTYEHVRFGGMTLQPDSHAKPMLMRWYGGFLEATGSYEKMGEWCHFAAVRDVEAREFRLYFNGKEAGRVAIQPKMLESGFDTDDPLRLASDIFGQMGETRLSSVARYDGDFVPAHDFKTDKQTVVLYHFNEGEGDILHDASGNGHDGKIVGAKWVRTGGAPSPSSEPTIGSGPGN